MRVSKDENISRIVNTEENNDGLHSNSINLEKRLPFHQVCF